MVLDRGSFELGFTRLVRVSALFFWGGGRLVWLSWRFFGVGRGREGESERRREGGAVYWGLMLWGLGLGEGEG